MISYECIINIISINNKHKKNKCLSNYLIVSIAVAGFPQYSQSCDQLFAGFAKCTSTARHIRHLFTKQFLRNIQFVDWLPRSPISREMFADPSQSSHLIVARWSLNSPIIRRFLPCLDIVWWANGACGDYNMNIQRTFSESHQMYSPQIVAKCLQNIPQLHVRQFHVFFATRYIRRNFGTFQKHWANIQRTFDEHGERLGKEENVWQKRRTFRDNLGDVVK